jgi:hypothetical protein
MRCRRHGSVKKRVGTTLCSVVHEAPLASSKNDLELWPENFVSLGQDDMSQLVPSRAHSRLRRVGGASVTSSANLPPTCAMLWHPSLVTWGGFVFRFFSEPLFLGRGIAQPSVMCHSGGDSFSGSFPNRLFLGRVMDITMPSAIWHLGGVRLQALFRTPVWLEGCTLPCRFQACQNAPPCFPVYLAL